MEADVKDGAAVKFPPPLVYMGAIIGGVLLRTFALSRSMPMPMGDAARIAVAGVTGLIGLGMMAGAIGLFKRTGQDPKPWLSTPEIISTGVYGFTRNPMYVGMALLQLGIGFGLDNAWIVLFVPGSLWLVYLIAVRHEETYLEGKFGASYTNYRSSVRRWL